MFMAIAISLLLSRLYRGTEGNTIANSLGEVPRIPCVMQAALAEGAQVMTAGSTLDLVIQVWLLIYNAVHIIIHEFFPMLASSGLISTQLFVGTLLVATGTLAGCHMRYWHHGIPLAYPFH